MDNLTHGQAQYVGPYVWQAVPYLELAMADVQDKRNGVVLPAPIKQQGRRWFKPITGESNDADSNCQ